MSLTRSRPIALCLLFVGLFACAQTTKAPSQGKQAKAVVTVNQKEAEDAARLEAQENKRRQDLYWALRTRVLTDKEMQSVEGLGLLLVVSPEVPFNEESKRRELNEALLQQFRIRHIARGGKP